MDLHDLRSFIESRRRRLEEDKNAITSKRRSLFPGERPLPPEDLLQLTGGHGRISPPGIIDASEVSDALCKRINNLTSFKNEVCCGRNKKESAEQVLLPTTLHGCDVISKHQAADPEDLKEEIYPEKRGNSNLITEIKAADEDFKEDKYPDGNGNPDLILPFPSSLEKQNELQQKFAPSEQKDFNISTKQNYTSPFQSREEEVERLQNKLSSASFWDDFGRSATGKKWSPSAPNTMVRVGEFSPSNPDLQAPLGLGEYEERRRQLLEKKKQEYKDYLSQARNALQIKTDHLHHPSLKSTSDTFTVHNELDHKSGNSNYSNTSVDAATQTDQWHDEQTQTQSEAFSTSASPGHASQTTLTVGDSFVQPMSPRVPRVHQSQPVEQLPDARVRQLQLQEELRLQIEEKRRLEAERREQERREEEALQRRVAEQQARLQAEYKREEKLRREREIQKQQQIEDFQRRQEELRAESEALKLEERRQKMESAQLLNQDAFKGSKNAHLVPPSEPAPVSILKSSSPPLRSPRRGAGSSNHSDRWQSPPVSPRALIKVLEGPTLPKQKIHLEDSLPIPLMPIAHSHAQNLPSQRSPRQSPHGSPHRSPYRSPHRSPHRSPRKSPPRFVSDQIWENAPVQPHHHTSTRGPSEAMRNLEERWKVPAVQKNVCVRGKPSVQNSTGNVLTQLGAFRRQLQMEHMRMEEKVKERHQYKQHFYQQPTMQRNRRN